MVAWSATAALAAYAQRRPSTARIGWLVAALGIATGLSAAVIGAILGFGDVTFRIHQIGISLLGPLYLAWGAVEYGVRSPRGRFASRLFLSAFTIVPLVVLSVDRLSGGFERAFPALADHYDIIPRWLIGGAHVVVAVFLVCALVAVLRRRDGGRDRVPDLSVLGLVALAALLCVVVGRTGLGVLGPLLVLGAVAALWGASAMVARPRRRDRYADDDRYDDEDPYDEGRHDDRYDGYDDADEPFESYAEPQEEPVRRRRRNPEPDRYDAPPARQAPSKLRGVITIYTLAEGQEDGFDQIADAVVDQVAHHEPDTLLFACHTVPNAPLQRIVYAIYRDELAREEHERQPHTLEFARRSSSQVVATNVIELSLSGASASDGLAAMLTPR
ncbi:putative quinol monooxygenase [Nocardiopsis sp. NPDC050513]|uniref:putative quinol monooxygenase n=1 Tax=Nocardiopsis sp. NPDC050513 TaxID=3364338 RepID=UPI0037BA7725